MILGMLTGLPFKSGTGRARSPTLRPSLVVTTLPIRWKSAVSSCKGRQFYCTWGDGLRRITVNDGRSPQKPAVEAVNLPREEGGR